MSVSCAVCGRKVRVSNGLLIKHRDEWHHVCDNSRCDQESNAAGLARTDAPRQIEEGLPCARQALAEAIRVRDERRAAGVGAS